MMFRCVYYGDFEQSCNSFSSCGVSVENTLNRTMSYTARPLTEFNKYEMLEMIESLKILAKDNYH